MGCEKLRCRRDVFRGNLGVLLQSGEDLVFFLGDVVLVEPAEYFHILAGGLGKGLADPGQERLI